MWMGPQSLVLGDEARRIFDQEPQNSEGFRPQGNFVAVEEEAATATVEHIMIER